MKELIISSISDRCYCINGDLDELIRNKRAKMMLRSNFQCTFESGRILFQTDKDIEHIDLLLKTIASYIGAGLEYDDTTGTDIQAFKSREADFFAFSQKAKEIKSNNYDIDDFRTFSEVLKTAMPCRRLYELQLLSAYHLAFSQNSCNFSVPGVGKTSIVYGAYAYLKNAESKNKRVNKLLIIGPLSSFGPWENEFTECFGMKADSKRIGSDMTSEEKRQYFYSNASEITLMSYQSLISLQDDVIFFLRNNKVMTILDEAHKIKNTNGGIMAASVKKIAPYCTARVVLTGTPAPNGYEDLYNLFHFVWPNHDIIKYTSGQLKEMSKGQSDSRVDKMLYNIDPYFIRIRKSDLHLPPLVEHPPVVVSMDDAQRRVYEFIEQRFVDEVTNAKADKALQEVLVKAKMIRLMQAATNPALLKEPLDDIVTDDGQHITQDMNDSEIMKDILHFYTEETPAKFKVCLKLAEEIIRNNGKVVIWATFIKNVKQLSKYLEEHGIPNRQLYGETPVTTNEMSEEDLSLSREGIISEFNSTNSSFNVIIANPGAVAESISLHKVCHCAIYLERSFNCAQFMQSKDRIHRYGLPDGTVTHYYYLISEDSIDETINSRLKAKEDRMLDIIENSPIPLFANVTDSGDEDIKAIIQDYVRRKAGKII